MIDLSKYRVIDLSQELIPGEKKIDGRYLHGEPANGRPVEVQEFIGYGARMHFVQGHTHCGTHSEATYKYDEAGLDLAAMPLESYMGQAAACDLTHKKAGEAVTAEDLERFDIGAGDVVLAWGSAETADNPPYLTVEAVSWLIETRIKLLGVDNVRHSHPDTPYGQGDADSRLLLAGIVYVDALTGLDQISKRRVFFMALPIRMQRVTASWTRAVALEETDH